MAFYRTVSLSFWTDSKVIDDFTPEDRYFFMYLITNPYTNLCGCYELSIKQAVNETGYSAETIKNLLERFSKVHNVIRYSAETKEVLILNWHKYNWTTSEKFRTSLEKKIALVKSESFRRYLETLLNDEECEAPTEDETPSQNNDGYPMDTYCMDTNCIDTSCSDTSVTVPVTDTDTDTVTSKDINNNINNNTSKTKKDKVKHKHGEYKKVLLTEDELVKLNSEFGEDVTSNYISSLDEYIAMKGDAYKSHYATIRNWIRRACRWFSAC